MDLHHEFTVPVAAGQAWPILCDLERLAPCLPGAQLTAVEGGIYRGVMKVKIGPIPSSFEGRASFVSRDDENFRAALKAEGRDTGGEGNASATITARLEPVDAGSAKCTVDTQLNIAGTVARCSRSALADASDELLLQFVDNLNALIASQLAVAAPTALPAPTPRRIERTQEVAPLDLPDTAGSTITERLVPVVLVIGAVVVLVLLFR
jgi:carbon monoxide dehydrogenase subunit G